MIIRSDVLYTKLSCNNIKTKKRSLSKTLYDRLIELKDASYRIFQMKLVPNIPSETILGVRTPQMRALAKEVFENDEREAF